jgi:hypothetical protein
LPVNKNDSSGDTGAWPHHKLQELQSLLEEYVGHRPKGKKPDEGDSARFRVTIDLLVSDNRRRDPDGAINTIMDCLVSAVRRFGEGDQSNSGSRKASSKRKRGSNN